MTKLLLLSCLVSGACTSYGTADGSIDFDLLMVDEGSVQYTVHLEPDGTGTRSGPGPNGSTAITLSDATRDTVYDQATDAHFADLPAKFLCDCTEDSLAHHVYHATVVVDGHARVTQTHQLDTTPDALNTLFETLTEIAMGSRS